MRGRPLVYLAFATTALALLAWGSVWLLTLDISGRLAARSSAVAAQQDASTQASSALRMHSLVLGTFDERSALTEIFATDVVGIANQIQGIGRKSGAATTIGAATPTPVPNNTANVHALEFSVQSTGTFSQVVKAAQLLSRLPLPSTLESLDFEQVPPSGSQKASSWQLSARIRVYTSADISS